MPRLARHLNIGQPPLLQEDEYTRLRLDVQEFPGRQSLFKNIEVEPGHSFALALFEGLLQLCQDVDVALPAILREGVPSGVDNDIATSNVFPPEDRDSTLRRSPLDFGCCASNWSSAEEAPDRVLHLLEAEEAKGWVERFPGTEADAEAGWPGKVVIGKLALISVEG